MNAYDDEEMLRRGLAEAAWTASSAPVPAGLIERRAARGTVLRATAAVAVLGAAVAAPAVAVGGGHRAGAVELASASGATPAPVPSVGRPTPQSGYVVVTGSPGVQPHSLALPVSASRIVGGAGDRILVLRMTSGASNKLHAWSHRHGPFTLSYRLPGQPSRTFASRGFAPVGPQSPQSPMTDVGFSVT